MVYVKIIKKMQPLRDCINGLTIQGKTLNTEKIYSCVKQI